MNVSITQTPESSSEQERGLHQIINCIYRSLELEEILAATVTEVRSLLGTDRVKIYKFHTEGSGQVVAEAIRDHRLPSLLGLNFPADDIPPHARELFIQSRIRSIVDVDAQAITQIPSTQPTTEATSNEDIRQRPLDPCHAEYLTAMGVKSSLVVPIFHHHQLWGLLVSHHTEPFKFSEPNLQTVQMVADQLSVAISHAHLLTQAREKAQREATINRIATLLRSEPAPKLQLALEEMVAALNGSGGRLCISAEAVDPGRMGRFLEDLGTGHSMQLFTCGIQPILPKQSRYQLIEQYSVWREHFNSEPDSVWAVSDLFAAPELRTLQVAFQPTRIRGILMLVLWYRQQVVGYLSVFRSAVETETLWAGHFDPDQRQSQPRQSFEIWRESKQGQVREWSSEQIELAHVLADQFATEIRHHELHQRLQILNTGLEQQVEARTAELQQAVEQQQAVFRVVAKIRESLDVTTIFQTTTEEVCRLLNIDRVAVYRFNSDWGGEFVSDYEFASSNWGGLARLSAGRIWNDSFLQERQGGRYRNHETLAVSDVYQAGFSPCHVEILEHFQIKAFVIAPIFIGQHLWGLLAAYQHTGPHDWKTSDIRFTAQIAAQLGVALQQAELLAQTRKQTIHLQAAAENLHQVAEQQRILFEVVANIRKSLELDAIFKTTTSEVRRSLSADRVGVFHFDPESNFCHGEFVSEDVLPDFSSALTAKIHDYCFGQQYAIQYHNGRIQIVKDIHNAGLKDCHIALLEQLQIRAQLVLPLMKGDVLWGLLCIHQCAQPRDWETCEIQFATQVAAQLGVALQQADLLAQTRHQTEQLTQALQDLRKAQTQLIQTEKMSSLGQLVAGVAHEINNPVNFIYGNLVHVSDYAEDLLSLIALYQEHYSTPTSEIQKRAKEIDLDFLAEDLPKTLVSMKVGADRIRQIVLSLRNFSRLDQAEMKFVDIHEGIDSTLLILQHRVRAKGESSSIELVKQYGDLPLIECYAGQLNQVFMNILSNAIDVLEESFELSDVDAQPQCLPISTIQDTQTARKLKHQKPATIRIQTEMQDCDRVRIRIADNGKGMSEAVRSRLFDPFFTTKPIGKGTGLGLSISYEIVVEKHKGKLECVSSPGQGAEFMIEIPIRQTAP